MTALTDEEVVQTVREAMTNWLDERAVFGPRREAIRPAIEHRSGDVFRYLDEAAILGARAVAAKLSGGACDLKTAAEFLLWQHDRGGPVEHAKEAWDALRAALATPAVEPAVVPDEAALHGVGVPRDRIGRRRAAWPGDYDVRTIGTPKPVPVADDLVERLTLAHDRLAQLDYVDNDDLITVLDARDSITADAAVIAGHTKTISDQQFTIDNLDETIVELRAEIFDREEAAASSRNNVRLIDIAMHGEEGAAKQASACDLVDPARILRERADAAEARITDLQAEVGRLELDKRGADQVMKALEALVPHWRSYRDIVDAITCKLAGGNNAG